MDSTEKTFGLEATKILNFKRDLALLLLPVSDSDGLSIQVGLIGLSARAYNCLRRNVINTVGEILEFCTSVLPGLGATAYNEIKRRVESLGYILPPYKKGYKKA